MPTEARTVLWATNLSTDLGSIPRRLRPRLLLLQDRDSSRARSPLLLRGHLQQSAHSMALQSLEVRIRGCRKPFRSQTHPA